jgi:AICAR transformylase/IMP cyclohydrolase PurH
MRVAILACRYKRGVGRFGSDLIDLGFKIVGTQGTIEELKQFEQHEQCILIQDYLASQLGYRLSREGASGLLATTLWMNGLYGVEVVACNFPPPDQTPNGVASHFGGVGLVHAAALSGRLVATSHRDYPKILEALKSGNDITLRRQLQRKALLKIGVHVQQELGLFMD